MIERKIKSQKSKMNVRFFRKIPSLLPSAFCLLPLRSRRSAAGQGTTEMVFLLPLLTVLAVGTLSIGYMCWQGIKVQQAANLAARVQGQERVAGGQNTYSIDQMNGVQGHVGDDDPTALGRTPLNSQAAASLQHNSPNSTGFSNSVFGKYYSMVQQLFGPGEQKNLFIPQPTLRIGSDEVKVVRVMTPPKVFGLNMPPVTVTGDAYGGEDPMMFSLPRWGSTGDGSTPYPGQPWYQGAIKKNIQTPQTGG